MFDVTEVLPAACSRSLRLLGARDHQYANTHRRAAMVQRACAWQPRAGRIRVIAARAEARAMDLRAEAR